MSPPPPARSDYEPIICTFAECLAHRPCPENAQTADKTTKAVTEDDVNGAEQKFGVKAKRQSPPVIAALDHLPLQGEVSRALPRKTGKTLGGEHCSPVPICLVSNLPQKMRCCGKVTGDQWSPYTDKARMNFLTVCRPPEVS